MAHPPDKQSDLTFTEWLDVCKTSNKGIKLDFKTQDVVEPCLTELNRALPHIKHPVILNADIFDGNQAGKACIDAQAFVDLCTQHCPNQIISIGWTTNNPTSFYSWQNVYEIFCLIKTKSLKQKITYPVRLTWAARSMCRLEWLIRFTDSTLTVWGHETDLLGSLDWILLFRRYFSASRVFFDLPDKQMEFLRENLDHSVCLEKLSKSADPLVRSYLSANIQADYWDAEGETYKCDHGLLLHSHGSRVTTRDAYRFGPGYVSRICGKFVFLVKGKLETHRRTECVRISLIRAGSNQESNGVATDLNSLSIGVDGTTEFTWNQNDQPQQTNLSETSGPYSFCISHDVQSADLAVEICSHDINYSKKESINYRANGLGNQRIHLSLVLEGQNYALAFDELSIAVDDPC